MTTNGSSNLPTEGIRIVDSTLTRKAIENVVKVDTEMLAHMDDLQDLVERDLTKFHPVIVAEFTPGGGKFTLLRSKYGNETRLTVEPVPALFAMAKSIAHAPLGIFGCIGPYIGPFGDHHSEKPDEEGWRAPLEDYLGVLNAAVAYGNLKTIDEKDGYGVDDKLKVNLVKALKALPDHFKGSDKTEDTDHVFGYVIDTLHDVLQSSVDFCEHVLELRSGESPEKMFWEWCDPGKSSQMYRWIVTCQVIAATSQEYGISRLMVEWKKLCAEDWDDLYVIAEAEWVTRNKNSIGQCIKAHMRDPDTALDQRLLIVTNLSGVEPALHFLARILEDRAAADLILADHDRGLPREHLSGQTDLLGPIMEDVVGLICPQTSVSTPPVLDPKEAVQP